VEISFLKIDDVGVGKLDLKFFYLGSKWWTLNQKVSEHTEKNFLSSFLSYVI